jgi:DNA-directed RNA polymerase subunit RPC12/RpoP
MVRMASFEFACPHCSERFELENPRAGSHVPCPRCGKTVAIPADLPQADQPAAEEVVSKPASSGRESPVVRLSREEKQRRRQIRSLVWMIGGAVLLAIATILLSRL